MTTVLVWLLMVEELYSDWSWEEKNTMLTPGILVIITVGFQRLAIIKCHMNKLHVMLKVCIPTPSIHKTPKGIKRGVIDLVTGRMRLETVPEIFGAEAAVYLRHLYIYLLQTFQRTNMNNLLPQ